MQIPPSDHDAAAIQRMEVQVAGALRRLGASRSGVLIALSGGADSMALAAACARLAGRLGLTAQSLTVDHGLRPGSAEEAVEVAARATSLGLTAHTRRLALAPGSGVEARAREARYQVLEAVRQERGLAFIATAHTANDQAETLLMRLGRGASLAGAAGVLEVRGPVLRPLLSLTRDEVLAYVRALGLTVVADPMNDDAAFLRVAVRQQLIPQLVATLGPRAVPHLAQFASLAAEDEAHLRGLASRALARIRRGDGALDAVAVEALELPIRRRVLAAWLAERDLPLDGPLLADLVAAIGAHRVATLPRDLVLRREGAWLVIAEAPPRNRGPALHVSSPSG